MNRTLWSSWQLSMLKSVPTPLPPRSERKNETASGKWRAHLWHLRVRGLLLCSLAHHHQVIRQCQDLLPALNNRDPTHKKNSINWILPFSPKQPQTSNSNNINANTISTSNEANLWIKALSVLGKRKNSTSYCRKFLRVHVTTANWDATRYKRTSYPSLGKI